MFAGLVLVDLIVNGGSALLPGRQGPAPAPAPMDHGRAVGAWMMPPDGLLLRLCTLQFALHTS